MLFPERAPYQLLLTGILQFHSNMYAKTKEKNELFGGLAVPDKKNCDMFSGTCYKYARVNLLAFSFPEHSLMQLPVPQKQRR